MINNSSLNFKLIHILLWIKGYHQTPNFETFECSGKNSPNSSCHFPNHKLHCVKKVHIWCYSGPHFPALGLTERYSVFRTNTFHLVLFFFSGFASLFSVMKQNSSVLFWLKKSYNLFKRSPLKCAFLNLFSARIKIRQIPHINFEMANQFQFKFRIIPHVRFKLIHFILWIKGTHQSP